MNTEIQTVNGPALPEKFRKAIDTIATRECEIGRSLATIAKKTDGITKEIRTLICDVTSPDEGRRMLTECLVVTIAKRAADLKVKPEDVKSSDPVIKNLRAHFIQVSAKFAKTDETKAKRLLPPSSTGELRDSGWTIITDPETGGLTVGAKKAHTRGTKAEPMVHIGPETRTAKAVAASDEIIRLVHDLCVLVENVKDATEQKSIRSRISNSLSAQWHNLVALREMKPTKLPTTVEGETTSD